MSKTLAICTISTLAICASSSLIADDKTYIPSSSPITMRPHGENASRLGYGYDVLTMTDRWKEDLLTPTVEDIGDIEYKVNNFVIGYARNISATAAFEFDVVFGTVKSKSLVDSYYSPSVGRTVNVDQKSDGNDFGIRAVYSHSILKQKNAAGAIIADWNIAFGLHASWFSLDSEYDAMTVDNQYGQFYTEESSGLFVRPVIALQPKIQATDRVSITPFIGADIKAALVSYDLRVQSATWDGRPVDVTLPTRDGWDWTESETELHIMDKRVFLGFDLGLVINKAAGHEISIGAVLNKLLDRSKSSFTEAHVLYSMPF